MAKAQKAVAQNSSDFPIVGIGASAGGLVAFSELLKQLPEKIGMAFVLVRHLDPSHDSRLGEILSRTTRMPVKEVSDGMNVEPDHVYVIPANRRLVIRGNTLQLEARPQERGQYLPVNDFFASLAAERGPRAIGVILSGAASDGTEGCIAIRAAGGITFAQDPLTAQHNSMPRSAINAGCIDFVQSPKEIVNELIELSKRPYLRTPHDGTEEAQSWPQDHWSELLERLREATGVDFRDYQQSPLYRRARRRMAVHKLDALSEYLEYLRTHPSEVDELYKDMLTHVTGFFRDPEAFDALRERVFPQLFGCRKTGDGTVRIWVPGCSTGEDVYSIAILTLEYLREQNHTLSKMFPSTTDIQFFATDISESAVTQARRGFFSQAALANMSPQRRRIFFIPADGGFQVSKTIRELCIFAKHNLATDPPFSNLDLISSRNLLIYLRPVLRDRVVAALHYALKPGGYLVLGESESLESFANHFALVDEKYKIYQKRAGVTPLITQFAKTHHWARPDEETGREDPSEWPVILDKEVDRILLKRYAPASIVVNEQMEIVRLHGRAPEFLEPAAGPPPFSLSEMAREGLLADLQEALSKAKQENVPVRKEGVFLEFKGETRETVFEVVPFEMQGSNERLFLVAFRCRRAAPVLEKAMRGPKTQRQPRVLLGENKLLKRKSAHLQAQLSALRADHQTTQQEFSAANEEFLSVNEELQSTNEELETAKEELQSTNEELATLNEELQKRNTEITGVNNDLLNLLESVNVPVVMVDTELRIRRFTHAAQTLLNLVAADTGRQIGKIRPNLNIENLESLVRTSIDTAIPQEREVREYTGTWHLMRIRPYKTADLKIDGAVIAFYDIDALKRTLDQTRSYADALFASARESILLLNSELRVLAANAAFCKMFGLTAENISGRSIFELNESCWNAPRLRTLLENLTKTSSRIDDFEMHMNSPSHGDRLMILNAHRVDAQPGHPLILLSIEDNTEKRRHIDAIERQAALLELAHDAVFVRDIDGRIQFWNRGAEEMYGWSREEAVGKLKYELLSSKFPKARSEIEAELMKYGFWEGEVVHTRKDGASRFVHTRWALRREGGAAVVLEINSDITEKKNSEENLRQLSTYLIRLQDEERRRIARELHDSTGQKLVLLKMTLESLATQLDLDSRKVAPLAQSMQMADEVTQDIRTISQLLHPPLLDEAGLPVATKWLVEGFSERSGIPVSLQIPDDLERLPQNVEIALFRVMQEALNNIHRHSGASRAQVRIARTPEAVTLKIVDNGSGFSHVLRTDTAKASPPIGVGIQGMKERLGQLGGTLDIATGKKGTTITARVPRLA